MTSSRTLVAALAAALAFPAVAQTRAADEARRAAGQPAQQGAPAAAPAAAPATGAQQGQALQLTQEQRHAIAEVVALNDLAARVGDLAAARATAPDLQNIGRTIAEDHRRIQEELGRLMAERGVANISSLPAAADKQRLDSEFMRLASLSGAEFDVQLTAFLAGNGPEFVNWLKRARDVTPGKDAQLKKYLDDAENVEEAHLAHFRQAKSLRQARTPPRQ